MLTVPGVGWAMSALLEVSQVLDVPLYDHRTRMGLADKEVGALVHDPSGD